MPLREAPHHSPHASEVSARTLGMQALGRRISACLVPGDRTLLMHAPLDLFCLQADISVGGAQLHKELLECDPFDVGR